jgi:hypothetical protein
LQSFLPLHACFAGAAAAPAGVADAVDVVVVRTAPLAAGASVLGAGAGDDEGASFEHPDTPSKSPATAADTSELVVFMRRCVEGYSGDPALVVARSMSWTGIPRRAEAREQRIGDTP